MRPEAPSHGPCVRAQVGELREEDELEWDSEEYTDVEAILIAEFLKHSTKLTRLDLARNQISDEGAIALATALCANSSIEYLNLESNNLSGTAGSAFCKAVEDNSSLQYLNIMYNALPTTAQQAPGLLALPPARALPVWNSRRSRRVASPRPRRCSATRGRRAGPTSASTSSSRLEPEGRARLQTAPRTPRRVQASASPAAGDPASSLLCCMYLLFIT